MSTSRIPQTSTELCAIGVDLGGTNMRAARVNRAGGIEALEQIATPVAQGPEACAQAMAKIIQTVAGGHKVSGVGIGSPGPLSRTQKMIFQTPNLPGFDRFPLGQRIEELTGLSVWLDNDAKCATYGEDMFGAAREFDNFVFLTFGTGVGGGVMVDGKMIYGKSDGACELGHMTLYPGGLLCGCGNRGCFEMYASANAVMKRVSAHLNRSVDGKEIFRLFRQGDARCAEEMRRVSVDFAIAIASFVNIFDPQAVILGGGLFTDGGQPLLDWIREDIKSRCFASSQNGLQIMASQLSGQAGILGAASLVFRGEMAST